MKDLIGDMLLAYLGLAIMMVMLYASPVFIIEKLLDIKPKKHKVTKHGEELEVVDYKHYLGLATVFWAIVLYLLSGLPFPTEY